MTIDASDPRPVAIVTGGAGAIGQATAELLSSDMAVVILDLHHEDAIAVASSLGGDTAGVSGYGVDVSNGDAVNDVFADIQQKYQRIDVLVNCAGFADFGSLLELTEQRWDRMMAVHARGTFNCTRAAVPAMSERGYGRIVNVSSVAAMSGSARHSHYAAAKAAMIGFTKAVCHELGPHGITVNCVAPGAIETPMTEGLDAETQERYALNAMGRIGRPVDVARSIQFLVSPGSSFMTGWVMSMNGGMYT